MRKTAYSVKQCGYPRVGASVSAKQDLNYCDGVCRFTYKNITIEAVFSPEAPFIEEKLVKIAAYYDAQ